MFRDILLLLEVATVSPLVMASLAVRGYLLPRQDREGPAVGVVGSTALWILWN